MSEDETNDADDNEYNPVENVGESLDDGDFIHGGLRPRSSRILHLVVRVIIGAGGK